MNYLTFIATIIFTVSLSEGVYILVKNPKSPVNRLFFFMILCLCFWLFGGAIAYSGRTKEEVILFFRISSFGFIFLHAFTLHFSIKITSRRRSKLLRYLVFLIYLPSFYLCTRAGPDSSFTAIFIRTDTIWIALPDFGSPTLLLLMINYLSYYVISAVPFAFMDEKDPQQTGKKAGPRSDLVDGGVDFPVQSGAVYSAPHNTVAVDGAGPRFSGSCGYPAWDTRS